MQVRNGVLEVVDGKQRLTSVWSFIQEEFPDLEPFRLSGATPTLHSFPRNRGGLSLRHRLAPVFLRCFSALPVKHEQGVSALTRKRCGVLVDEPTTAALLPCCTTAWLYTHHPCVYG